jgi:DNA repair exonuclease SbcCD ATPase subunit
MKHVNFNRISIKNFLSVGPEPVIIDFTPGLHIITGINKDKQDRRNGVGKSTIADAIHFAIFGNTIRDLKKDNIVNNLIGRDCEVILDLSITDSDQITKYKIARTLEPSKCFLYINGEDKTRDTILHTTEYICELVNTSQDIFQNCVIMTLNNTVPFMGKKKVEKRKFIEGIFNLEVFGQMLGLLRQDHNEVKKNFEVAAARSEESEKNTQTQIDNKALFIKSRQEKHLKLKTRQESNIKELNELQQKVFDTDKKDLDDIKITISQLHENIKSCDIKLTELNKLISTHETEIKFKNEILSKIGTDREKCPVCLKDVSDHDRDHISDEKQNIRDEIDAIDIKVKDSDRSLQTLEDLITKLRTAKTNQNNLLNDHVLKIKDNETNKERIKQLEEWLDQLDQDLAHFHSETDQFDKAIQESKNRQHQLSEEIKTIKHKLAVLDVVKFIVSEEGVKSYIVRKILQLFNHKLQYYLQKMDANCCCIFNEYFEDEIVDEKGHQCSYFNFSGAERKNIDLACLFAFMDIRRLQGNVAYNISVYDELLDSSLDERGVELVLDILRQRVEKYNECIMIISHRKESVNIGSHYKNPGEVIFLEKEKGITRRVDFADLAV